EDEIESVDDSTRRGLPWAATTFVGEVWPFCTSYKFKNACSASAIAALAFRLKKHKHSAYRANRRIRARSARGSSRSQICDRPNWRARVHLWRSWPLRSRFQLPRADPPRGKNTPVILGVG